MNMLRIHGKMCVALFAMSVASAAWAYNNSETYSGQGLVASGDGGYVIGNEICGVENGAEIQGAYLLWVLTATRSSNANISFLGSAPSPMKKFGNGVFKYVSGWMDLVTLPGNVVATYDGAPKNAQLVISHGCAPAKLLGAWCSPGYWANTLHFTPNGWTTIGVAPPGPLYGDVIEQPLPSSGSPTLLDVLQNKSAYFTAQTQGAAFNAVAAYLTDLIPGYEFDESLVGSDDACPLDAHGNFK
jgi:hypothetical protein